MVQKGVNIEYSRRGLRLLRVRHRDLRGYGCKHLDQESRDADTGEGQCDDCPLAWQLCPDQEDRDVEIMRQAGLEPENGDGKLLVTIGGPGMSVNTLADDYRDEAVENVRLAISNLSEIVIEQCLGHDDWTDDYRAVLKKSLLGLIEIRDQL